MEGAGGGKPSRVKKEDVGSTRKRMPGKFPAGAGENAMGEVGS